VRSNNGRYAPEGMACLSFSIFCALSGVFFPDLLSALIPNSVKALNSVLVAGATVFGALWLMPEENSARFLVFLGCLAACAALTAVLMRVARYPLLRRILFPGFLVFQAAFWLTGIYAAHQNELTSTRFKFHVRNDVQTFAEVAAQELTAGRNPYSVRMPNVMGADMPFYSPGTTGPDGKLSFGYPYLPLSALFSLPGHWLGDFRLAHVFALIGAACLLAYARPSTTSQLAATFFLLFPPALFILMMSWIEPVVIFFMAATIFCTFRAPRWLFLTLGCLIASKQYTFFLLALLPLLVPEKEKWRPLLWRSVVVALVVTLPMALWDVGGFYHSVVEIQFKQPFREDSLSYLVTVLRAGGPQLSPLFGFVALLGGLAMAAWKAPRSAAHWCGAGAVAYLGFFALNKQAFANYYFWPFGLLMAAVAIALPPTQQTGATGPATELANEL
jgi:hypothetical protein